MQSSPQRPPVWLFAHPSMSDLAENIVKICCTCREGQNTHQSLSHGRSVIYKDNIQWGRFRDGWPDLFIKDVKEMAGKDVLFLASFHSPEVVFEQLSLIYAMPRYLARSFHLIMPYFPTGTMERVDTEGQIATAKTLATMLSSIPLTARGPAQIMVFDIHALQERFYFSETVIPRLETAIPLLLRELVSLKAEKLAIAFPDDGAFKRFNNMFHDYTTIVCHKIRHGTNRIVKVRDGNPAGCHVIIVDDLVQTGGTLIECAKALLAGGATCVSAYVTHAVFPNNSWQQFVDGENVKFKNFWITDSLPHAREITKNPPFRMLSLSAVIANVLLGYDLSCHII